jgi:integrase
MAPGVVFATRGGQPLSRSTVRSAFNRVCLKVIGEAYQLRETRHTAISFLSHNGVSLEAISDLARHKDSTVTRKIYRHVLADEGVSTALAWDRPPADDPPSGLSVAQSA